MTAHRMAPVAVILLLLVPVLGGAQVQIIRELPQTGENRAQAQWGAAVPTRETPPPAGVGFQLGGHIGVGGSAGINEVGTQTLDATLDTALSLLLPLGASSRVLIAAEAVRKPQLDGLEQSYKAGTTLTFDAWQADIGGTFHQQDRNNAGASSSDLEGGGHASLTLGFIPTLPISASYTYERLAQSQSDSLGQPSAPKNEAAHHAQLKAVGTLGEVGVDSGASFSDVTDLSLGVENTSFGGNFALTVPVAPYLKAFASVAPKYDATAYSQTGNGSTGTSLETNLGVIIPVSAPLSFKLAAGRVDLWSSQTGPSADPAALPYQLTWHGTAGVELKQETGMSAETTYVLGKTLSGPWIHSFDAAVGYKGPKDDMLKDIGTSGTWLLSLDDAGVPVDSHAGWKASVDLGQQDALALTASYNGSMDGISQTAWSNAAHATFSHQVIPELGYSLAANVASTASPTATATLDQQYQGKVTFSPRIDERTYTIALDDSLGLAVLTAPVQVVSRAGAEVLAPVFTILSARYRFEWEWDAQSAPGAGPDSSYHHIFGATLNGQPLPFSLTAEYGLTYGFRGLRHDVTAGLSVSAIKNLSIQGSLRLSAYQAGGADVVPFLATLTSSYQF